ncbi:MAG: hypothetical protein ABI843_07960 [Dokdonella sp.]
MFASATVPASDESLSFRRAASRSIEAVVSGLTDTCDYVFLSPDEVTIEGTTITIVSPDSTGTCYMPAFPLRTYSGTADLGALAGERYSVFWNQPVNSGDTLQLTGSPTRAGIGGTAVISAPTLSWAGILFLMLGMGLVVRRHRNVGRSKIWRCSIGMQRQFGEADGLISDGGRRQCCPEPRQRVCLMNMHL